MFATIKRIPDKLLVMIPQAGGQANLCSNFQNYFKKSFQTFYFFKPTLKERAANYQHFKEKILKNHFFGGVMNFWKNFHKPWVPSNCLKTRKTALTWRKRHSRFTKIAQKLVKIIQNLYFFFNRSEKEGQVPYENH